MAEGVGFEPTLAIKTRTVFKTVSINRSDTPPQRKEMIAQGVPIMTVGEVGWQGTGIVVGAIGLGPTTMQGPFREENSQSVIRGANRT